MVKLATGLVCATICFNAFSVESSIKGLVDIRASVVNGADNAESYLTGDYGKFRYSDGTNFSLGQLGLHYQLEWQNQWSVNLVGNGFADSHDIAFGLTEAYGQYKGLPTASGWRFQSKIGVYYPQISLENIATAWSTPYSLTSSTINNWIGEELRNTGINIKFEKLGKATKSPHSVSLELDVFQNNDSAGAMLSWHGWTVGSRQTLLSERLIVQDFPARNGMLAEQAAESDPFIELDNRWGVNVTGQWRYQNNFKMSVGFYDNQAEKGLVENGQYTWTTSFIHAGFKYQITKGWELMGQYMSGSTLMTSPTFIRVVDNDFDSQFLMLRRFWGKHHIALRIEDFNVDDRDETLGDNNNESGNALSFAYRYSLNRQNFLLAEYTAVDSHRASRQYQHQPIKLKEQQYQVAYRYYF